MSKVFQRLLVFIIGVPLVAALVLFLPYRGHLALNIAVVIFSALGALEFSMMLEKKNFGASKIESLILGSLAPLSLVLVLNFNIPQFIIPLLLMSGIFWAFLSGVFAAKEKLESISNRLAGVLSVLVYPGFFMYWIVKMTTFNDPGIIILVFLLIVFGSDSAAWLFGSLFGKGNRGIIPASPNKSVAGYAGGIIGSIIISAGAALLLKNNFIVNIPAVILTGFITGIAAALGDLAESAVKRSCDVKDSGSLILGRGGVLDSIDSIAFAAPVYFALYSFFFLNA